MALNSLPVSRVVAVSVDMSPRAAALRSFGSCMILGDSDVIDTDTRFRTYSSISEVAAEFGTEANEYQAALAFFSQSPRPSDLRIGRWAKVATKGRVLGRILSKDEQEISRFNAITTGTLNLTIDGSERSLTALNFASDSNLNGVASRVTTALNGAGTCVWNGQQFEVISSTTGTTSSVAAAVTGTAADVLGLSRKTTAVSGIEPETIETAVSKVLDDPNWYALFVSADMTDDEAIKVAGLISAAEPSRIVGFTSQDTSELSPSATETLGFKLKELGYNRAFVMYSSETKFAAVSVIGRMATVNFEGNNTCITLKFKQCPGVAPEYLTTSQANALKAKNVNVFAAYQNDTAILQEGVMSGGWFIDETHGLDWLQNRVQTDLFNLLYTSTTKIGQDESGICAIIATVNRSLSQSVSNGLVAPGTWNGNDIGELKQGDALPSGYYVYVQPLDEQAQADREARKAPPVQCAIKLKGAVHFVDVAITVNR